jgi:hypothetical protein
MTLFVITLENAVVYQIWTDDEEGAVVFDQWSSPAPPHAIVNTVPDVRPEKRRAGLVNERDGEGEYHPARPRPRAPTRRPPAKPAADGARAAGNAVTTAVPRGRFFRGFLMSWVSATLGSLAAPRSLQCSLLKMRRVVQSTGPRAPRRRLLRPPQDQASEKDAELAQKLGQLQPFTAALVPECMGQLASYSYSGPT